MKVMTKFVAICILLTAATSRLSRAENCKDNNCICYVNAASAFCNSANLSSFPPILGKVPLTLIDLSDNLMTSLSEDDVINSSRGSLQQLILRNNRIGELPQSFLRNMTSLHDFDVSWNKIEGALTSEHFVTTTNLDYLSLAHNKITCIQEKTFSNLKKLTELDLSHNRLTSQCIPREALCDLESLIVLRLSSNRIPKLFSDEWPSSSDSTTEGFFSCLHRITNIKASNCDVTAVSSSAFQGLDHLTSLDLSDNFIVTWHPEILRGALSLVYLDLENNFIRELPPDFIQGCPKLRHLSLRNNELKLVDYRWFEGKLPQKSNFTISSSIDFIKQHLKLTPSNGQTFQTETNTNGASDQMSVDWSGNPWLCDCEMLPFIAWLLRHQAWFSDVKGYHDVICYDPSRIRGSALLDVYVEGMVNIWTLRLLIDQCVTPEVTSLADQAIVTSSKTLSVLNEVITTPTTTQQEENIVTSTTETTNELEFMTSPWYKIGVRASTLLDADASVVMTSSTPRLVKTKPSLFTIPSATKTTSEGVGNESETSANSVTSLATNDHESSSASTLTVARAEVLKNTADSVQENTSLGVNIDGSFKPSSPTTLSTLPQEIANDSWTDASQTTEVLAVTETTRHFDVTKLNEITTSRPYHVTAFAENYSDVTVPEPTTSVATATGFTKLTSLFVNTTGNLSRQKTANRDYAITNDVNIPSSKHVINNKESKNKNTNESSFRVDKQEKSNKSYVTIVLLSIAADIVVSLILFVLVRKWCKKKKDPKRWATVVPMTSLTPPRQNGDVIMTPVQL